MQRKPLVLLLSFIIIGALARAQDDTPVPPPSVDQSMTPQSMDVSTPDQVGDADPLDVLEPPKETPPPPEPIVPQFTEVPAPGQEPSTELLPPQEEPKAPDNADVLSTPVPESSGMAGNDPDFKREERFHEIYKQYNEQPTSEEAWDKAVSSRQSQTYKVQKGDTLWDVSNTFFGDPHYWPKIWSLNVEHIGNPHEIDPKMMIQFFPGTMDDAPTVGMVDANQAAEMKDAPKVASNEDMTPLPARKRTAPVLKELPPSIPLYRYGSVINPPVTVEVPPGRGKFPTAPEYLSYYIVNQAPQAVGQVVETEMGMETATEYQYVIVRLDEGAGKDFIAVKDVDKVTDFRNKDHKTDMIEVQGAIEVIEKVNESKNLYRALVKKTIEPINVGAKLLAGPLPTFDPTPTPVVSSASAVIIGGQYEGVRKLFPSRSIVFLDAGSSQGLQEGQSLNIYSDIRNRNKDSKAMMNDRQIGTLKIIRVADNFSTAYITHATDDVFTGDHVGSATAMASAAEPAVAAPEEKDNADLNLDEMAPADVPTEATPSAPADDKATSDDLDSEF